MRNPPLLAGSQGGIYEGGLMLPDGPSCKSRTVPSVASVAIVDVACGAELPQGMGGASRCVCLPRPALMGQPRRPKYGGYGCVLRRR